MRPDMHSRTGVRLAALLGTVLLGQGGAVAAQGPVASAPSYAESFRVGTSGPVCEAQAVPAVGERGSIYDRKWVLLCREVARPIGVSWFLRSGGAVDPGRGLEEAIECGEPASSDIAGVTSRECRGRTSGLPYRAYQASTRRGTWSVTGLAAYDSALRLALQSLLTDRIVPGEISVASTGAGSGTGFFAAKARVADAESLLGQGYRRNAAGSYAESAQLFGAVEAASRSDDAQAPARRHEQAVNRALQLSNLGEFDQAAVLFSAARGMPGRDPVQARLARNFEAIDALNRGEAASVEDILGRAVPSPAAGIAAADGAVEIDSVTAAGLGTGTAANLATILGQQVKLTPAERAEILDAQADALRGTALRIGGRFAEARALLVQANRRAAAVRDGRVLPVTRLRSQIIAEIAQTHESQGDLAAAEARYREAEALVSSQYPDSASVNAARARIAGFLARHGRKDEARTAYRSLVTGVIGNRDALVGMSTLIQPYFDLLTETGAANPSELGDLLLASQLVERPGAADTLQQLARELEGGSDEAAALFRSSLAVGRDLERSRVQAARLAAAGEDPAGPQLAALARERARLEDAQLQLTAQLSAYPRYRAVSRGYVTLDELQATLKPGEAYLKLVILGERAYSVMVTPTGGRGWKVGKSTRELSDLVTALRDSISVTVNNVRSTYPFDLESDLVLSEALLGPARGDLAGVSHLVFEPDGPLLQLPLNLLVLGGTGVEAYRTGIAQGRDEFDMRGIEWLGRGTAVSTALSAASFRDARRAPASRGGRAYLGLGQNRPLGAMQVPAAVRGAGPADFSTAGCEWPAATWNQPISAAELRQAAGQFGSGRADLMTDAAFTDSGIEARRDLADFRVLHFATHGLVTAPRPGCPARPALVTSFGDAGSDGLLRFDEIFDLGLDADLIILSACDTAGGASLEATREAGVVSGGGQALDGLVRAFIAAGGRQVIASHWPAPDDFNATQRLIGGFLAGPASMGEALRVSQTALMDGADTSHPFYWAGFAIVGDAARPVPVR